MTEKIVMHGPGYYVLTLTGARNQPIFNSVFDYDYGESALAQLQQAQVLGFCMAPTELVLLVYCEQDWTDILDQLQVIFRRHNETCWRQSRSGIADSCQVVLVDEVQFLSAALLQLHNIPVQQRWVIDAELYPWSSDRYYRQAEAPEWLHRTAVLNNLCKVRHNQTLRYQAAMAALVSVVLNIAQGNHPTLAALSRRDLSYFISRGYTTSNSGDLAPTRPTDNVRSHTTQQEHDQQPQQTNIDPATLYQHACQLVSNQFEIAPENWINAQSRRHYNNLMPIVAWLLHINHMPLAEISAVLERSDDQVSFWLRSAQDQHSIKLLNKLQEQWHPSKNSADSATTTTRTATTLEDSATQRVTELKRKQKVMQASSASNNVSAPLNSVGATHSTTSDLQPSVDSDSPKEDGQNKDSSNTSPSIASS